MLDNNYEQGIYLILSVVRYFDPAHCVHFFEKREELFFTCRHSCGWRLAHCVLETYVRIVIICSADKMKIRK